MNKHNFNSTLACAVVGAALLFGLDQAVNAQSSELNKRLSLATHVDCTFDKLVTGDWKEAKTDVVVSDANLELSFIDVNIDEGTADAEGVFGSSLIIVRQTGGYLHFMQMFGAGPLYVTTVLAQETSDGKLMAVHTRHEYTPVKLVGYTSRPEMYLGECSVAND